MKNFYIKYKIQLDKIIFLISIFASIYIFVNYILNLILPFFIAFIFSIILEPVANFFTVKVKAPRWFGSLMCILLILFVVLFVGTNIISQIIEEAKSFSDSIPDFTSKITEVSNSFQLKFDDLFSFIPKDLKDSFSEIGINLLNSFGVTLSNLLKNSSVNIVTKIPSIMIALILTLISTFFFINDKKLISQTIARYTPLSILNNVKLVRKGMFTALVGYVKAQLIIMSIMAVICIVSLYILKYPYALFVALIIAGFDALPLFGSGFVLWPWIAFSFFSNNYNMAIGLLITYATIFITRQIIEPRILGKQIGIHPLITLMSIYIGLKVFGAMGLFVGPLSIILAKTIFTSDATTNAQNIITAP